MRLFVGAMVVIVCAALLSSRALAEAADSSASPRLKLDFDPAWQFIKQDIPAAKNPSFDDSKWATVSCPHTYNDVDTFDDWSLAGHRGEQNQFGGRTWYRKTFTAPEAWRSKNIYIEFEGARQVAEVYLNGELLGVSKTGFIPFGFDLTPHLKIGQANVLAVMCDNRFMKDPPENSAGAPAAKKGSNDLNVDPPASAGLASLSAKVNANIPDDIDEIQADQIPWNNPHWHPAHGGLYRNVYLYVVDPLHVSLPLYSFLQTAGPYVYSTDISDSAATVHLELPIENGRRSDETIEVVPQILDRDGKVVATLQPAGDQKLEVDAGKSATFNFSANLSDPQLWEPDFPYMYRMVCTVRANGEDADRCEVPFGIRTIKFDTATGFYINGHHTKIHGWGQKPTDEWPGLGAAQPNWMHWFTLDLMKQAGANWVRWGHCMPGPTQLDANDQLGLMVQEPGLDGESDTRGAAWKLRAAGFRDMLIYCRNHPAIMIWEAGNQKVTREHAQELHDYFQKYDPNGGRAFGFRRADKIDAEFMTVCLGTEGGREIKDLPVVESEYDREESPRRVWDDSSPPNFGYPEAKGMTYDLTSEQYAVNQIAQWVEKCGAVDHCGGANWIFSDTTSGGRVPAEVARAGGEVDGERLPKEAYYVCQTMWRSDPQVHIIGHWTYPAGTKKTIYVASNGEEVELLVNGKSLGHAKPEERYLFTFPDISFEPGEIKAIAYLDGRAIAMDAKKTAGEPVALKMTTITGPGGLRADGSDIALIDVEAIDANGERCPTFQEKCNFTCTGNGVWRGGYNSGKTNSINNTWLDLECGINRVAIRSTLTPGKIIVDANSDGLKPTSIEIVSNAVEMRDGMTPDLSPTPPQQAPEHSGAHDQRLELSAANVKAALSEGKLITGFSYSGPKGGASIKQLNDDGDLLYSDRDLIAKDLPGNLKSKGGEYIQLPCADASFSAVDLIQFSAGENLDVYIAHDDRASTPSWLSSDFTSTGKSVTIDGANLTLFHRSVNKDASLTLGSNSDDATTGKPLMYLVIALPR